MCRPDLCLDFSKSLEVDVGQPEWQTLRHLSILTKLKQPKYESSKPDAFELAGFTAVSCPRISATSRSSAARCLITTAATLEHNGII